MKFYRQNKKKFYRELRNSQFNVEKPSSKKEVETF